MKDEVLPPKNTPKEEGVNQFLNFSLASLYCFRLRVIYLLSAASLVVRTPASVVVFVIILEVLSLLCNGRQRKSTCLYPGKKIVPKRLTVFVLHLLHDQQARFSGFSLVTDDMLS